MRRDQIVEPQQRICGNLAQRLLECYEPLTARDHMPAAGSASVRRRELGCFDPPTYK